ncbi:hypothetical protein BDV25DRAFT_130321 [Aspergillus avenaceus]|uniref:Transcription factor domain-containing protein n=1 Tax=Aspergillus avenaceus TaxID=36643 RepID=A0A5N6TT09_ASPAV|nr:hypothetical protein BDV25DRAFT_130321 [Aspergillus avenaceus]
MLTQLVLAHHMLFLVIATEGTLCPTRSQMLYRYTITAAEKLGLFSLNIEQTSDTLFSTVIEDQMSWKLWSRVESVKNLIIGLTLLDSSLSRILSTSPMINTDNLQLALPCDSVLYRARTAAEWSQLARQGFSLTGPTMSLPSRVHISCLYGPMCVILVRMTANYHRLIVNSDLVPEDQHQHVPWRIYSLDKRARMITPLVVHFIQQYEVNLQGSNPNCVVMWHNLCLWLTADTRLLERAAGREGSEVMQLARQSLYVWAKTPAARRACLHAAQIFYSLSNWRPSYGIGYQPVNCLFQSALVLSLYILVSQEPENTQQYRNEVFDLARANIDWKSVGDEGLAEAPTDPSATGCPAVNFIRYGGPIVVCGKTYVGGARHARRLILDFASLLDEVGKHWMATYPRLLYMIHDTMVDGYVGTPS